MVKVQFTKTPSSGKYIVTAFQTIGYISILAAKYLEEKGAIQEIGFVDLEDNVPIAMIIDGAVKFPIRVLEGQSTIFITSEFPIQSKNLVDLATEIFNLSKKYEAKGIIALDGLAIENPKSESEVFYVSTGGSAQVAGAKKLEDGVMMGLNAELALKAKLLKIPTTILMAETHSNIPDGIAAAALINVLGNITKMAVDTTELVSEYKKTVEKINDTVRKMKQKEQPQTSGSDIYG